VAGDAAGAEALLRRQLEVDPGEVVLEDTLAESWPGPCRLCRFSIPPLAWPTRS
jgi:hypothetical protein